ncbi:hypothetical protein Vafri_7446 [Volvox africanus]|uniref:Uncharacterized protein n=1 Tax=Volvox africanus TaxID=51714 RepID=A0A8J4B4I2_9CHLO|nr:hypothetical protein Vafri_7446 [Volvox africanus]
MVLDRDARRIVQVLVPGMPPPVLDYVFASVTKANARPAPQSLSPHPPRYALRRCDGGTLGELSILDMAELASAKDSCRSAFGQRDALAFHYRDAAEPRTIADDDNE